MVALNLNYHSLPLLSIFTPVSRSSCCDKRSCIPLPERLKGKIQLDAIRMPPTTLCWLKKRLGLAIFWANCNRISNTRNDIHVQFPTNSGIAWDLQQRLSSTRVYLVVPLVQTIGAIQRLTFHFKIIFITQFFVVGQLVQRTKGEATPSPLQLSLRDLWNSLLNNILRFNTSLPVYQDFRISLIIRASCSAVSGTPLQMIASLRVAWGGEVVNLLFSWFKFHDKTARLRQGASQRPLLLRSFRLSIRHWNLHFFIPHCDLLLFAMLISLLLLCWLDRFSRLYLYDILKSLDL